MLQKTLTSSFLIAVFFIISSFQARQDPVLICYSQLDSPSQRQQFYNPYSSPSSQFQPQSQARPEQLGYGLGSQFHATVESKEFAFKSIKRECEKKNAVHVPPFCLKFIIPELSFQDARDFCISIGADLWIPDLTDPFLFQNLAKDFPVIFGGSNHTVWIGITLLDNRFMTIDGDDVTTTYLGLMGDKDGENSNCVFLHLLAGLTLGNTNCTEESDFVCQFQLEEEDEKFYKKTLKYV